MLRRTLPGLFALFALVLVACGGGDSDDADPATPGSFPTSTDPARTIPRELLGKINVVAAGGDYFVGDNNFVFGITDAKDNPQGGAKTRVTFYDLSQPGNPRPVGTYEAVQSAPGTEEVRHTHASGEVHVHGGGDEDRVGYYVRVNFPHAGFWGVFVEAELKDGTKGARDMGFQVYEKAQFPAPGQKAIPSDNLTKADVADIAEIDSGSPPNDMHDIKIKDAIAKGRPLVIVFATPAYCTSRFCGPVTEEVESLYEDYKDRVDFVHIEIWRNFEKRELNPTVKEWLVQPNGGLTEPWVYVVGKDGVIYDRWEGPVARNIMEASVRAVAEGKVWGQ